MQPRAVRVQRRARGHYESRPRAAVRGEDVEGAPREEALGTVEGQSVRGDAAHVRGTPELLVFRTAARVPRQDRDGEEAIRCSTIEECGEGGRVLSSVSRRPEEQRLEVDNQSARHRDPDSSRAVAGHTGDSGRAPAQEGLQILRCDAGQDERDMETEAGGRARGLTFAWPSTPLVEWPPSLLEAWFAWLMVEWEGAVQ